MNLRKVSLFISLTLIQSICTFLCVCTHWQIISLFCVRIIMATVCTYPVYSASIYVLVCKAMFVLFIQLFRKRFKKQENLVRPSHYHCHELSQTAQWVWTGYHHQYLNSHTKKKHYTQLTMKLLLINQCSYRWAGFPDQ